LFFKLCTLLDAHTQRYRNAQQGLLDTFESLEHDQHERQPMKERLDELYNWLQSYVDMCDHSNDLFSKLLSLNRSKLDEQIIHFRQFHAQLRTRRHVFDTELKTNTHIEQVLDNDDRKRVEFIEQQLQMLDQQANSYNERLNRLSTRLNEYQLEYVHLTDEYSKRLRLYREHLEQNDDINFSTLQLLINDDRDTPIETTSYEYLMNELLKSEHIEDENDIHQSNEQMLKQRCQYETFQEHMKRIIDRRQELLNDYETKKSFIHDWLVNVDRLLKQQSPTNDLTLERCEALLIEHADLPINGLTDANRKLIEFYTSDDLRQLYEQLHVPLTDHQHSNTTSIFKRQTDELVDNHRTIRERIVQHMNNVKQIQKQTEQYRSAKIKAEQTIDKAKELVTFDENTILPLDNDQIELLLQHYKVNRSLTYVRNENDRV
jgi:hypothetical protein